MRKILLQPLSWKFMCDCDVCLLMTRAQDTTVFREQLWEEGMTLPFSELLAVSNKVCLGKISGGDLRQHIS